MKQLAFELSLLCAAVILIFNACSSLSAGSDTVNAKTALDSVDAAKAVEKGQQRFMDFFKKGDSTGVAGIYTTDAKVMNAGSPAVQGRDNIIHFFGKIFSSGPKIITVKANGVWSNSDMIVEEGKWIMANKDGKEYDHGKYLILWKIEDGEWKKFRDCHNSDIYPLSGNR